MTPYELGYKSVMNTAGLDAIFERGLRALKSPLDMPRHADNLIRGADSKAWKRVGRVMDELYDAGHTERAMKLMDTATDQMGEGASLRGLAEGVGMTGLYGAGAYRAYNHFSEPEEEESSGPIDFLRKKMR